MGHNARIADSNAYVRVILKRRHKLVTIIDRYLAIELDALFIAGIADRMLTAADTIVGSACIARRKEFRARLNEQAAASTDPSLFHDRQGRWLASARLRVQLSLTFQWFIASVGRYPPLSSCELANAF